MKQASTRTAALSAVDIPALLPSWQRSLRAARRSPRTVQSYTESAKQLADFLVRRGMPQGRRVDPARARRVLHRGPGQPVPTDRRRSLQVAQADVPVGARGGGDHHRPDGADAAALGSRGPTGDSDRRRLRALLKACEGQEFVARRDTAIIMTFIDTGARLQRWPA